MIHKKNPAAVELGKLGGLKGGPARAKILTKERLKGIASLGAKTRWNKGKIKKEKEALYLHNIDEKIKAGIARGL